MRKRKTMRIPIAKKCNTFFKNKKNYNRKQKYKGGIYGI